MPSHFCLTIHFLQPYSHGRGDDSEPEWPPSPLRLFQALVASAAARWNERIRLEYAVPALRWLEQLTPLIVASPAIRSDVKYRLYVPDNVADKVARSWSGGREASIADYRTEKDVRPTHLLGDAVHYLFAVTETDPEFERHRNTLIAAARSITHLGWGVDMVAGNATVLSEEDAAKLSGERWRPAEGALTDGLRVPIRGTLDDLASKHQAFLNRLSDGGFKPVPPLSAFRVVGYRRATDTASRPFVAFELRTPDFERSQPFDPTRHACAVAGMVRNSLADLARQTQPFGWTDEDINSFVLGHTRDGTHQARGSDANCRFAYLPLPSLEWRRGPGPIVTAIRRILVVGPPGWERQVVWARVLSGRELTPLNDRTQRAALRIIDRPLNALRRDTNLKPYIGEAQVWSTVTPVILPGYDEADPKTVSRRVRRAAETERRHVHEQAAERTLALLQRAMTQAGYQRELAQATRLEWRPVGFRAGLELATRYTVGAHHERLPRYHVRITWPVPVRGPVCLGTGRYYGMGLFAAEGTS